MKPIHITLRQLQVFIAVAHKGSVSLAADQIGMTQSAASMALADLERHLDSQLFDRIGKKLQLNHFGEHQLTKAELIISQAQAFEHELEQAIEGPFTLACSMTIGSYLMPAIATQFLKQYPLVKLAMPLSNTQSAIHKVKHFEADLGLIEGNCHEPELRVMTWKKDRLIPFAASDSKWAKLKNQTKRLLESPWILREPGSGTRAVLEQALEQKKGQLNVYLELASHEAIKQAALSGMGIGCLSEQVIKQELQQGLLTDLSWPELDLTREFSLIWRPERYLSPAAKAFIKILSLDEQFEQSHLDIVD